MSHIEISKKHSLGKNGARNKAEKLAESLASEFGAECIWKDDDLSFTSSGVKGELHIGDDDVEIKLDLSFILRPLKSKIKSSIVAQLDDILADDTNIA